MAIGGGGGIHGGMAGVGSGIAGASQSGIGAAPGSGGGYGGRGGQNIRGVAHNYSGRFTAPRRGMNVMSQIFRPQRPVITPTRDVSVPVPQAKPTQNVGPSSEIGALVAMGIDPGLAAALAGKNIGSRFGDVASPSLRGQEGTDRLGHSVAGDRLGSSPRGAKGDYGGTASDGAGSSGGGSGGGGGGGWGGPAPADSERGHSTHAKGFNASPSFRGGTAANKAITDRVGVETSGRAAPRGDRGIRGAAGSDLPGSSGADNLGNPVAAAASGATFPGSDNMLDSVFSAIQQMNDYFAGQRASRNFQNSRVGGVGGPGGVPPRSASANFSLNNRGR